VFDTPLVQHALSPANALDATSIAAATNPETVILIMVNAQTRL
jgi:N-acetylmuramic acid 6-phosphate (MurNAc-6-P) etherase